MTTTTARATSSPLRASLRRIWGLMYRHLALFRASWPRIVELMYWPILQMVVWGFLTVYLAGSQEQGLAAGPGFAGAAAGALLGAVLLWEVALRGQMGFAISFLEEIWSRNLGHVFVSPLRPREFVAALMVMSLLRTLVAVIPAMLLAWTFYGFGITRLGPLLVVFFALLLVMGWAVALFVTALILRHGSGAEGLAWGVLFGITPFAAVFYPVSVLPPLMQNTALGMPAGRVFEGMRAALLEGRVAWDHLVAAVYLDVLWLALGSWIFLREFQSARVRGALLNVGE